jgi:hypothetical protein
VGSSLKGCIKIHFTQENKIAPGKNQGVPALKLVPILIEQRLANHRMSACARVYNLAMLVASDTGHDIRQTCKVPGEAKKSSQTNPDLSSDFPLSWTILRLSSVYFRKAKPPPLRVGDEVQSEA